MEIHMSEEILQRLTAVETQQHHTAKTLDTLASTMAEMSKEVANLAAALRNPSADHCVMREAIVELKGTQSALDTRLDALERRAERAQGGWSVVHYLLSGGLLAILGLLSYLVLLAQHLVK